MATTKIAEMVRNSPLGRRKGYSPVRVESEDPFVQGITFHAHFVASIESPSRVGSDEVQDAISAALDQSQKSNKPLRKIAFVIKAVSLAVRDVANKTEEVYPIYMVSYCGNSRDANTVFFILHKTKVDRVIRAEIFKCNSREKVAAISRTVSKAFNVAYKAWCTKKRLEQKKTGAVDSPLLKRATAGDGKTSTLKPKEGVAEFYTPPVPKRETVPPKAVRRSGSFGDEKEAAARGISRVVQRVIVENEQTGE